MCNFYHFIVHLICRFCTRFSYTVIWKHSQFYVSVTEKLSLEQLNDNCFKSLALSHPYRPPAKTAVLLHLFVFRRMKIEKRWSDFYYILNRETERTTLNQLNSHLYRTILRNILHTFTSVRVPVYRSAHAWFHLCVTYIASRHVSNYAASKCTVISELIWFSKKAAVA